MCFAIPVPTTVFLTFSSILASILESILALFPPKCPLKKHVKKQVLFLLPQISVPGSLQRGRRQGVHPLIVVYRAVACGFCGPFGFWLLALGARRRTGPPSRVEPRPDLRRLRRVPGAALEASTGHDRP